ncbi:hypothetical protein TOPH_02672 [Tolypocladium ophioglossoides CBS 100239]|uniref:Uncharacterized protein n=1 Tax=Tolypocladium ophioglossoides (strain CBS 100239) TaxID=1163406 RepID=A0A0L0NEN2_TOLOC|nr:hypothetical protein TOPH_02672 [Tolypocladium ophioglossoides CBS 100239]
MAIPWDSIRGLLLFFGPILLPKAVSYYRSVRSASRAGGLAVQPVPGPARTALALLLFLAAACLLKTLPPFAPENLFAATQSRLQIPVDVLFNRVAALRPGNALTRSDEALRAKFVNLESRLLYLQFGPDVLADCPFCSVDEPKSYFYYALPAILWPHLENLIAVAVVTSPSWTSKYGSQWRALATIAGFILAGLDVYFISSYGYQTNARALRLPDIDFFYWSTRNYRLVAFAALDGLLGWVLYLSSTNRAFAQPPSPAERIELVNRGLMSVKSKINAVGIINNTALRDEDLRARSHAYWAHEVRLMREVMEEREVIEGVNDALSNRIDIQTISRDAEAYSQSVLQPLHQEASAADI